MPNEQQSKSGGTTFGDNAQDNVVVETVHGDFIYNAAAPPKPPTPHQLRKPLDDFVGREKEIAELLGILRKGGRASLSGISGMGGIGKTELALIVADRLRGDYPDAQLFLEMRGTEETPLDPAKALASCIRAFEGLEVRLPDEVGELNKMYLSLLNGKRALVVLDNAANRDQVKWLVPPAGCALLVTSRNVIAGMDRVTLNQLKPEEARELLISICARITPEQADQISYLCGNLPLAIRAAGSLLDVTVDLDVADYIIELTDEHTRLEAIGTEGVDIDVEASFNLSYARLEPEAARVFRGLSVFPESFNAQAEENVCEDTQHKYLSELLKRSLVLFEEAEQRYRLHDLARVFAAHRSPEAERLIHQQRHAEHFLRVLYEANDLYLQGGKAIKEGLALFDWEWSNAQAGWEWIIRHIETIPRAVELCNKYPNAFPHIAEIRQHPRERIAWLETALVVAQAGSRKIELGFYLNSLGGAYSALSEYYRAIEFYEQGLAIAREIGDRIGEGHSLNNLGNIYADMGEARRAITLYEQSLSIKREVEDSRGVRTTLNNLGTTCLDLGEYRRSIEYFEQSLSLSFSVGDRRGESIALNNLGEAYRNLGETDRAIEYLEKSLPICNEIGDQRGKGMVFNNLGLIYSSSGDIKRAIEYFEQSLLNAREIGDRRGEGGPLNNLGNAYFNLGNAERALGYYSQLLAIGREIGDRYCEGTALWNTAEVTEKMGDIKRAIEYAEAALVIHEQIEDPFTPTVRETLARWRGEIGAADE